MLNETCLWFSNTVLFVNFCNFLFQSVLNFEFLQYAPLIILRSLYYPIKDIFGNSLCYYTSHSEVFTVFLSQYQSFFITLFRYICLFQNQLVVNLDLKPRNLAQITVFCLFFISLPYFSQSRKFWLQHILSDRAERFKLLFRRSEKWKDTWLDYIIKKDIEGTCYFLF